MPLKNACLTGAHRALLTLNHPLILRAVLLVVMVTAVHVRVTVVRTVGRRVNGGSSLCVSKLDGSIAANVVIRPAQSAHITAHR